MPGSRNFHERGSNENGNFWSQTRGVQPPKNPEITFVEVKFSNYRSVVVAKFRSHRDTVMRYKVIKKQRS